MSKIHILNKFRRISCAVIKTARCFLCVPGFDKNACSMRRERWRFYTIVTMAFTLLMRNTIIIRDENPKNSLNPNWTGTTHWPYNTKPHPISSFGTNNLMCEIIERKRNKTMHPNICSADSLNVIRVAVWMRFFSLCRRQF